MNKNNFCNIINATFDQFNVYLLNKNVIYITKSNFTAPNFKTM